MATPEEIRHRVEDADTARSTRRAATAQQVGQLAQRRAIIAEQLDEIERLLGEVIAAADDVIGIDELAQFTDVKAADLTRWLETRTTSRAKRKKPAAAPGPGRNSNHRTAAASTPEPNQAPAPARAAKPRTDAPARAMAEVT